MRGIRTTKRSTTGTAAAAALLTASLVLTGCGAGGSSLDSGKGGGYAARGDAKGVTDGSGGSEAVEEQSAAGKPSDAKPVRQQHVIRTASLTVEVEDATKALVTARRVAAGAGGRVENESTERLDDTYVMSRVVLRVPQEQYDAVLVELAGTGRLLNRKADAKDVTEQVVDVESRIATQRASVARVRALMDKAEKLADVVTLEGELSRRQADLESLLAQQASLKDRTTLATITLELTEKEKPEAAKDPEDERPGVGDALSGGWNALVDAVAWIVVVLAALAPWLAVALGAFLLWRRFVRPRRAARAAAQAPAVAPGTQRNAAGAPIAPVAGAGEEPSEGPAGK
ncbi:DUF4349 domain-containing protein [Streptomyces sp. NPDC020807]|uniref:DUF4349 domain-containing protein n=1 Tax=Streptomyces sp. NPDC020807 TaxID=3155119 RepID=UPI0033E5B1AC